MYDCFTWEALKSASLPDAEPLIEQLLYVGENTLFVAPQKSAKTLFSLQLSLSLAAGVPFARFWRAARPARVLYIACEGTARSYQARTQRIVRALGAEPQRDCWVLRLLPYLHINTDAGYKMLRAFVNEHRPRLLVLDPLFRFHKGTLTDDGEVGLTTGRLNELTMEYQTALWVPAHEHRTRRDMLGRKIEEGKEAYFGSHVLTAWCSAAFGLSFSAANKSATLVANDDREERFRDVRSFAMQMRDTPDELEFVVAPQARVAARLSELQGLGIREAARLLNEEPETVRRALAALQKEGKLLVVPQQGKSVIQLLEAGNA